jgi:HD-GYP domain-containing protein (c-di-GMP phosphodiesterase class II)
MDRLLRSHVRAYLFLIAAAAVIPAAAMHFIADEPAGIPARDHLLIMAIGAGIAATASIGLLVAGVRADDARSVLAGGAFAAMTLLLALHGLATPGVLFSANGVLALAGGLALPVGGALLTLAAVPALNRAQNVRRLALGYAVFLCLIAALGAFFLADPAALPKLPQPGDPLAVALLCVGAAFFAVVAWRASRTFALTRRLSDLSITLGVIWMGVALVPQLLFPIGGVIFWIGHVLEFSGVAAVGLPMMRDAYRGRPSHAAIGDLSAVDLVSHEAAFLGPRVRVLMTRLEHKDVSTEQHTRRVAEWAVLIGEELGMAPGRLRELALAGLLHDMGKLTVPTAILTKPGPLDDEEMAVVQMHAEWGDELLAELGYPESLRRIVRGHHERLDGGGYPDGLRGDELDLPTRIMAVADVYDALVSDRVYRPAWEPARALALLHGGAGEQFDARCVEALERQLDEKTAQIAGSYQSALDLRLAAS